VPGIIERRNFTRGRIDIMAKKANGRNSAKPTVKTTDTLSPQQVEKVVIKINKMAIETVERGAMEIGNLALEEVFQGSLDEATSLNPYKNRSMMLVCAHADLLVNRRRLGEWVRAAGLRKDLIAKDVDCSNLSYSHFAALLQVEDEKNRNILAAKANKGKWSARKLAEEIGKMNPAKVSEGKSKDILKILGNPEALMKDKEAQRILENPQDLEKLPFDIRLHIAKRADEMVKWMVDSTNLLKLVRGTSLSLSWEILRS
jgi:hypothetical protein